MAISRPFVLFASALVVGGVCGAALGRDQAARLRLDAGFGDGGVVQFHSLGSPRLEEFTFAAADAQHIYVAGNKPAAAVARFDLNGRPDETFGSGGVASVPLAGKISSFSADDGVVLCGGFVASEAGGAEEPVGAVRLLEDGSGLDATFGTNGMLLLGPATGDPTVTGLSYLARDPRDGSYVAHAPRRVGSRFQAGLIRFSKDGVVDPTFGGDGYAEIDRTVAAPAGEPSPLGGIIRDLVVDPAGRTIVSMVTGAVRFLADGTLDPSFRLDDADGNPLALTDLEIDDAGRILGYGFDVRDGHLQVPTAVHRWHADGEPDGTFGPDRRPGRVSLRGRAPGRRPSAASIAGVRSLGSGAALGDQIILAGSVWFPPHRKDEDRNHNGWYVSVLSGTTLTDASTYTYRNPRPAGEQVNVYTFAVAVPDGVIVVGTDEIFAPAGAFRSPFLAKVTFGR